MKKITDKNGFTIIELLIALSILGLVLSLTISNVNWKDRKAADMSTELMGHLTSMELAVSLYFNNTNGYPTGLGDTAFVPSYLFAPRAPVGFDRTFGVGGYYLGQQTVDATTSNNGHYICGSVTLTTGATDARYVALTKVAEKTPTGKFYYAPTSATVDCLTDGKVPLAIGAAPAATDTIHYVYWLTRD